MALLPLSRSTEPRGLPLGSLPIRVQDTSVGFPVSRHPVLRRLPSNALNGMEQNLKARGPEFRMAGTSVRGYSNSCGGIQRGSYKAAVVAEQGRSKNLDGVY